MSNKDLWVVAEVENGALENVTLELVGAGQDLAQQAGAKCAAVLVTAAAGELPQQLIAAGADTVYVIEAAKYADYDTELFTDAICQLIKAEDPAAVMFGATANGRDLAPRMAARLKTGLSADCTQVEIGEEGFVEWTRPALGGNICATILCEKTRPQMGTVRPKVFKAKEADASRTGEVIAFTPAGEAVSRVEVLSKEPLTAGNTIKIDDAEVLVSGGRGIGSEANVAMLQELADLFENSAISGSRAIVDEGWLTHSQQVGQSGKTVSPKVYFACGISGAIQHIAGMKDSEIIVAINKDAGAPIFEVASYGLVGDVTKVLPKLAAKIKAYKEQ